MLTGMEQTQCLGGIQSLKIKLNKKVRKWPSFVETTVEAYIPKDWKFRVDTTIKFRVEKSIKVFSPKEWNFSVDTTE